MRAAAHGGASRGARRRGCSPPAEVELSARRAGEGQWPQAALGLAAARAGTHRSGPAACAGGGVRRLRRRGGIPTPETAEPRGKEVGK